jgi:hypothetical protein
VLSLRPDSISQLRSALLDKGEYGKSLEVIAMSHATAIDIVLRDCHSDDIAKIEQNKHKETRLERTIAQLLQRVKVEHPVRQ